MISRFEGAPPAPRRNNLLGKLRKALRLLRTVDLEDLIAQFDARQQKIEALLLECRPKIEALLQGPDSITSAVSVLDIKNLGYEIGRQLAEKNLADRAIRVDHTRLMSKLCTQDDFAKDWLLYWCSELRSAPIYHRKIWEICYVAQALFSEGQLAPGRRGIGFGCGGEPLPSLFAKYGTMVTATDLDSTRSESKIWQLTSQHASAIETIRRRDICPDEELLANIEFQSVDMNAIPGEFDGRFDFCWSTCALEHLGTLKNGLTFIENSLRTLKPGGLAVHTTEFTLNEGDTIDNYPIVLYQRHHFEDLASRLSTKGYEVVGFDFNRGDGILDRFVDLPPYFNNALIPPHLHAHLRLLFDGHTCTSIGIIIKA